MEQDQYKTQDQGLDMVVQGQYLQLRAMLKLMDIHACLFQPVIYFRKQFPA